MSFSPGQKSMVVPMLFGAPTCTVCGKEMEPSATGRPRKYCSKACSSRADRARERERQEQALAAAAENPRGETPPLVGPPADGPAAGLLELGEELRRLDERFLLQLGRAERESDGALAHQALGDLLRAADGLAARHRELAERILSTHPTQTAGPGGGTPAAVVSPRGETTASSGTLASMDIPVAAATSEPVPTTGGPDPAGGPAPIAPRGETPPPVDPVLARPQASVAPVPPRGETRLAPQSATAAPIAPRGETPPPPGGERLRGLLDQRLAQQQTAPRPAAQPVPAAPPRPAEVPVPTDPLHRRLPPSDVHVALDARLFGDYWALAGWTVNPDVYLVLGEGHQVGWVERGLAGIGGQWVAMREGYFIGNQATQEAMLHDTPEQAAFTVHTAYLQNL
ncbi:hypothetical protein ACIRVF_42175 [Kitasatospora sp. NPDC101157]|uniref:hypothetical protein n=1 Tax=Kitasatospora sp. NPDC101157 TaxID=3364098 RepID=UPI003803F4B3